jgi:class 3 adenylate cyclase/pimeloyl-ACP methyl ester carboxylesterase
MAEQHGSQRLAVIVAADIAGYSRLVSRDERETLDSLRSHRSEFIDPTIDKYRGRLANTAGDSLLLEFPSVVEAADFAIALQRGMAARNANIAENQRIDFRIGINLGDVFEQAGDLLGEGVNIAARLEAIAPPREICVSEIVKDALILRDDVSLKDLGAQRLKNIPRPIQAYLLSVPTSPAEKSESDFDLKDQNDVRFVLSKDGVSIAHASVGNGYPLAFAGSWMTHLTKDWDALNSVRPYLTDLSRTFRLIRYDQRGNGMSDWKNVVIEFERMVDDLERVIDCYPHEKVAVYGASQAASVSIAYAIRRPEKVSHLILYGGYARGRRQRGDPNATAESEALVTMIRQGWGASNPAFRQMMTTLFMPGASAEEAAYFNDFQKACGPAENIARFREMFDEMDVSKLLPKVTVPTLVIHSEEDSVAPLSEGRYLAASIPGARFVMLKSKNHMLFENEPDFPKFLQSIRDFVR